MFPAHTVLILVVHFSCGHSAVCIVHWEDGDTHHHPHPLLQ